MLDFACGMLEIAVGRFVFDNSAYHGYVLGQAVRPVFSTGTAIFRVVQFSLHDDTVPP